MVKLFKEIVGTKTASVLAGDTRKIFIAHVKVDW